jgi:glyoxylase-like metal-dependent hydrolase (beta-lactamase superfamily II)
MQETISAGELKKRLDARAVDFMLDLRNADEFKAWRIEGKKNFPVLNIPQEDFIGEEERHRDRFPKDAEILVVCAHGDSSRYTAELLNGFGLRAVGLEGGMDAWSEYYERHRVAEAPEIYQIYRTARGCISHMIVSRARGEAAVIDAVRHIDQFVELAASLGVTIRHVLDTHLHADHISGGRELANRTGAIYHLHTADADQAKLEYAALSDGDTVPVGEYSIRVIHSPGHTPGSTSFLLDDTYLFTGDTIMKTSIGRPDLGGQAAAWSSYLYHTLFNRFKTLEDALIVLPSHAASIREQDEKGIVSTTLGAARKEHDLYQILDIAAFARHIRQNLPENPERYQDIRMVNLFLQEPDEARRKELEIGKNVCGMAGN